MPPKKAAGVLASYRQKIRATTQAEQKELEPDQITEEMIANTPQITILKKWAVKLGVPNLVKYRATAINALRGEMIKALREKKVSSGGPQLVSVVEDDQDKSRQYQAIEKFIRSFKNGKVSSVFGEAGDEFVNMWNTLDSVEKKFFVRDYFEMNVAPSKINPVLYLRNFIESRRGEGKYSETAEGVGREYLQLFLQDQTRPRNPATFNKLQQLEANPLMSAEFLTAFRQLDQARQLEFARQYTRAMIQRNPYDALQLFLRPKKEEPELERKQVRVVHIGGVPRSFPVTNPEKLDKNNYSSCLTSYLRARPSWLLYPINLPANTYSAKPEFNFRYMKSFAFVRPTEAFFMLLCQFQIVVVESTREPEIPGQDNRITQIQILADSIYTADIIFEKESFYRPTVFEVQTAIQKVEQNQIYAKLDPIWLLNQKVTKVPVFYLDQPLPFIDILTEKVGGIRAFNRVISRLQKEPFDSLLVYYTRLFTMFFPFLPMTPAHEFSVVAKLKAGYLTPSGYAAMSLSERIPEIDLSVIVSSIENYTRQVAPEIIRAAGHGRLQLPAIEMKDFTSIRAKCPDLNLYQIEDIIIYTEDGRDYCFTIPDLLRRFRAKDFFNAQSGNPFRESFIQTFLQDYSELSSNKFTLNDGSEVFVDRELYDQAHPVVVRAPVDTKWSPEDVAGQFDAYFGLSSLIPNPVELVNQLLSTELKQSCLACAQEVRQPVSTLLNRSDGSFARVHFCSYRCMDNYEFAPLHVAEEEISSYRTAESIVEMI